MKLHIACLICVLLLHVCNCLKSEIKKDYAMSVAGLRVLLDLQALFIDDLDGYTQEMQLKIDTIESFLQEVRAKQLESMENPENYVAHPLNGFSLIRRLHEDWSYFEHYMKQPVGKTQIEHIRNIVGKEAPQLTDVNDAMEGLIHLQSFYQLHAQNLTKGLIDDRQHNTQLTLADTFRLAQYFKEEYLYSLALDWFQVSIDIFDNTEDHVLNEQVYNLTAANVYGDYLYLLLVQGYLREAEAIFNKLPDLDVDFWLTRRSNEDASFYWMETPHFIKDPPSLAKLGCANKFSPTTNLTCHFQRNFSHFLTLAPLKVEILSLQPYIVQFHDVIYSREMEELKSVNLSSFKHQRTEKLLNSMKYTILERDLNDVLNYRVRDMTGMSIDDRHKDFTLINFGLAGHLSMTQEALESHKHLASIMFFLSDVPQGGATVFDKLNISVKTIKGSALLWHNVDNGQNKPPITSPLSCPVMVGSKWTLIKRL